MMERVLAIDALLAALAIGATGGLIALVYRLAKGDGAAALWRALEAFLLGVLGALVARAFISVLLAANDDSVAAQTVVSLLFFIVPGIVNLFSLPFGDPVIGVESLLWLALLVGGLTGLHDGLWAIHRWRGLGVLSFLLDVTWGLAGSTIGVLLHLVNVVWGRHADDPAGATWTDQSETRHYAHRYVSGFRLKPTFAFTQGAVMSNMDAQGPTSSLHRHESIHVWQNRLLGPFFWFSYVGWMVMLLIPALIAGLVTNGKRVGAALEWWCYFNNPWEIMAYGIANPSGRTSQPGGSEGWLCWMWALAIPLGVLGIVVLLLAFLAIVSAGVSG